MNDGEEGKEKETILLKALKIKISNSTKKTQNNIDWHKPEFSGGLIQCL